MFLVIYEMLVRSAEPRYKNPTFDMVACFNFLTSACQKIRNVLTCCPKQHYLQNSDSQGTEILRVQIGVHKHNDTLQLVQHGTGAQTTKLVQPAKQGTCCCSAGFPVGDA